MTVFYSTDYNPGYPFFYYDYDNDGQYDNEHEIEDEATLVSVFEHEVVKALKEKRRLVVCDELGYCLLHLDKGKIIFPQKQHLTNPGNIFTVKNSEISRL